MSTKIYPIYGRALNIFERRRFGHMTINESIGAILAGEFRYPQMGEWFISGAIPMAYKAPTDLSMEYHIAKLVKYRKVTKYEIIE